MPTLRKTIVFLVVAVLLFAAVPTSAELVKYDTTGFSAMWFDGTDLHQLRAGIQNGRPFGYMFDMVFYGEDEESPGVRWERRVLTDVTATVASDLASATMSGALPDGTLISATFAGTGDVQNVSPSHPAPWASGMDCDGVSVSIHTGKVRDGRGSVTLGDAEQAVTGQLYHTNDKVEPDSYNGNYSCTITQPHGPKTPPDQR